MALADPWDTTVDARRFKRKLLEKDVQKACVAWARENGWWARKFSSPANRSVPDYLFARKIEVDRYVAIEHIGAKVACEFKAPGKTSTDAQLDEQQKMRDAGWTVIECDNIEWFKTFMTGVRA